VPSKKHIALGIALWVLPFAGKGLASAGSFPQASYGITYMTASTDETNVWLSRDNTSWVVTLRNRNGVWQQTSLLPLHHPLDNRPVSEIKLHQEAHGFSVQAVYPVMGLQELIRLRFKETLDSANKDCPLLLTEFRREQKYATTGETTGELRSGIVADYEQGIAHILAIEGLPAGTLSKPVRLLPQNRSFCSLPSALEFTPNLEVPKVR
jgi:hypothetical protein